MDNFKVLQFFGNNPHRYLQLALVNLWQAHMKTDKQIGCSFFSILGKAQRRTFFLRNTQNTKLKFVTKCHFY